MSRVPSTDETELGSAIEPALFQTGRREIAKPHREAGARSSENLITEAEWKRLGHLSRRWDAAIQQDRGFLTEPLYSSMRSC